MSQWRREIAISTRGFPYSYWVRAMPRIPDQLLEAVVYLYPDEASARKGEALGGSGFVVEYRSSATNQAFHYVITNQHVAGGGCSHMRINTHDGEADVHKLSPTAWVAHDDGDDVAIAPLGEVQPGWAISAMSWANLCPTPERMEELNVGVGDDVLMVGRFMGHQGRQTNQPMARFGNIGMMPGELVRDGRSLLVEAFLVEMRSLPGFSGSPVFLVIGAGSWRGKEMMMPFYSETIGLLGIDTGHKVALGEIKNRHTGQEVDEDWRAVQDAGVAIVAPYWKIADVLEGDELRDQRETADREWIAEHGAEQASSDVATQTEFEKFETLARRVVSVPKIEVSDPKSERDS